MAVIPIPQPNGHRESSLVRPEQVDSLNKTQEKTKIEAKPLKGNVKQVEPSFREKLKRSFIKEDLKDIKDYIIFEMLIPNAQRAFFETIVGTAAQIFGVSVPRNIFRYDGYSPNRITTRQEGPFRDYSSVNQGGRFGTQRMPQVIYNKAYVNDFRFDYEEDAQSVIEQLIDISDSRQDGWITVSDFFEIADPNGVREGRNAYTNEDYGWPNSVICNAYIKKRNDGYSIILPAAKPKNLYMR